MGVIGKCKLCSANGLELRKSHILPAWAYKRSRDPDYTNPNPVLIVSERAVQTSRQLTEYLLCDDCESQFGKVEDLVSRLVYQADGSSVLPTMLGDEITSDARGERWMFPGDLPLDSLIYFCASVIWRAAISRGITQCDLGIYAEPFRAYLHGETAFPTTAECVLKFYDEPFDDSGFWANITYSPVTEERDGYAVAHFVIFGLQCQLFLGATLPLTVTTSSSSGPPRVFKLAPQMSLAAAWMQRIGAPRLPKPLKRLPTR